MSKVEIIPAILPMDWNEVVDKIEQVKGFVKHVQIDVCDGRFVANSTWPYRKQDDNFEKILSQEIGFPAWQELDFEVDLMVDDPENRVDDWVMAGADRVIIHIEAKGDVGKAISELQGKVEIGIALNEETSIDRIAEYSGKISFVQLMGIDNVGFQHQKFDEKTIERVKQVKDKYPELTISVDGGVSIENAQRLIQAGANRLVMGSAIYNSDNPIDAILNFKTLS